MAATEADGFPAHAPVTPPRAAENIEGDEAYIYKIAQARDEDAALKSLALPAAHLRRIVRAAAPNARFSAEAVAGLHRTAQAYVLWAVDQSLAEAKKVDGDKHGKKSSKVAGSLGSKRMTAEHVMRFLTVELPPIASKIANLYPDFVPVEYKPAAVRLLEELRDQNQPAPSTEPANLAESPAVVEEPGAPEALPSTKRQRNTETASLPPAKKSKASAKATPVNKLSFSRAAAVEPADKSAQQALEKTEEPVADLKEAASSPAPVESVTVGRRITSLDMPEMDCEEMLDESAFQEERCEPVEEMPPIVDARELGA